MGGYWYTTKEGDTWDYIAWKVYGDEYKVPILMQAQENYNILEEYIFSAGIKVWCPEIEADTDDDDEDTGSIPTWRDEGDEDDSNDYDSGDDDEDQEDEE